MREDNRDGKNEAWSNGEDLNKKAGGRPDVDGQPHLSSRGQEEPRSGRQRELSLRERNEQVPVSKTGGCS